MNVLLIGREKSFFGGGRGGGDFQARHLRYAQALRTRCGSRSSIRIIVSAPPGEIRGPQHLDSGLSIYPVPHSHRLTYQLAAHRALRPVLADWRPDLISTQTPFQDGLVGLRTARRLGIPLLAQVHFNLLSPDWRRENLLSRLRYPLGRYVLTRADRIRAVSSPLKRGLVEQWGIPATHVHVVPVGVTLPAVSDNLDQLAAQRALDPQLVGHPVVLFIGRLAIEKNLPLLIAVARRVLDRQPEVRFVIVGDGPERAALQRLIEQNRLMHAVTLTGTLPYERLPSALAASNLLLLASNHEGFGRVIVEAYFAGRPVVTTRCCGPEDLVVDGRSGYLLPIGDEAGLSQAVERLVTDDALARTMGQYGQRDMQRRFSLETLVDRLIDCWEMTAAGSPDCVDVMAAAAPTGEVPE